MVDEAEVEFRSGWGSITYRVFPSNSVARREFDADLAALDEFGAEVAIYTGDQGLPGDIGMTTLQTTTNVLGETWTSPAVVSARYVAGPVLIVAGAIGPEGTTDPLIPQSIALALLRAGNAHLERALAADADQDALDQGSEVPDLSVVAHDLYFVPDSLELPADTPANVRLENEVTVRHNLSIDELGISSLGSRPGASAQTVIDAPAGEYEYHCNVPGHKRQA
ncbi:MAG: cupredoxin domain-containing protein [Chloroflexia bacterium]|nr:cupredoxin domain-containing protein [Chloroflexia bacterium]